MSARRLSNIMHYFVVVLLVVCLYSCKGQGEVRSSDLERIRGGEPAPEGRYPYMCSIRRRGDGEHICGGVLIDKDWVMTAAHCLDPKKGTSAGMSPFIFCNIYEREDQDISKRFTTERCYLHHLWGGHVLNGADIALCQLDRSADWLIPDLANVGEAFDKNDMFSIIGWGGTSSTSNLADVLQIGSSLIPFPQSICNNFPLWRNRITASMICAGRGSPDACKGDSGGPLFIPHDPTDKSHLDPALDLIVGITSFGTRDCDKEVPGVYTRISCFRPWIECIMQGKRDACNVHIPCQQAPSSSSDIPSSTINQAQSSTINQTPSSTPNRVDATKTIDRAILEDDSNTVKKIVEDGLSPDAVFSDNEDSLLIRAARYNALQSAKVLLDKGADIGYKNNIGQDALGTAAVFGSFPVAQLLVDRGANIESRDNYGYTPLSFAAWNNRFDILEMLLDKGADIESKNIGGLTPLHLAAIHDHADVAEELINAGAKVDNNDKLGFTALHHAANQDNIDTTKRLITAKADVNKRDNGGSTPLHIAARENSDSVAEELISNEADIEVKDRSGNTPLAVAAYYGSPSVLKVLLNKKAKVDTMNKAGQTPLHLAASRGHPSIVQDLIRRKASTLIKDNDDQRAVDVICMDENLEEPCTDSDRRTLFRLLDP